MTLDTRWNLAVGIDGQRQQDFQRPWYTFAMELVQQNFQPDSRILEVCCGAGEFSILLRKRGYTVTSVDGDLRNIELLKNLGFDARTADIEKGLPFESNSFDAVVILEGIEHIVNCERLIEDINRCLKPKGLFLLSTPNFSWIQDRVRYLLGANATNEGVHLRFFTVSSLSKIIEARGFKVIARNSFSSILVWNRLRRLLMHRPPQFIRTVAWWESLLAQDFVWLCQKIS